MIDIVVCYIRRKLLTLYVTNTFSLKYIMIVEYFKTADEKNLDGTLYYLVVSWNKHIIIQDALRTDNFYYCEVSDEVCDRLYNRYRVSYLYINKRDFDELIINGYEFKKIEKEVYFKFFTIEDYVHDTVEREWYGDLVYFGDIDFINQTLKKSLCDTFEGSMFIEGNEHYCIYKKCENQDDERLLYVYSYDSNEQSVHLYDFVTREYYCVRNVQDVCEIYDTYIKPSLDKAFNDLEPFKGHVLSFMKHYDNLLMRCLDHSFEIDSNGMFGMFKFHKCIINISVYFDRCQKCHLYVLGFEDDEVRDIVNEFYKTND